MKQPSNVSCVGDSSKLKSENIKVSVSGGLHATNKLALDKDKNWMFEEAYLD